MSFGETIILPERPIQQLSQLVALLDRAEPRVRRRFLRLIRDSKTLLNLEEVAGLLESGQIREALAVTEDIAPGLANSLDQVYTAAGLSAAETLRSQVDTLFDFNLANQRAVQHLQQTRLRLVREFSREQLFATQDFLQGAFTRGLSPIEQARELQKSIGLTRHQAQIIQNYRRNLEFRSPNALTRVLRDKRFDGTVRRAIRTNTPLSTAQIDRMVDRYQERWVRFRADTIAKTESLQAVSAGDLELWEQAIDEGVIAREDVINTWRTSKINVRSSHQAMEGQKRPVGETFLSGDGNALRFPGDGKTAPASDTVNCHCVVARKIKSGAAALRQQRPLRVAA